MEFYYLCNVNKGADQLRSVTAELICAFVFAYAECRFSHDAAYFTMFNFVYVATSFETQVAH